MAPFYTKQSYTLRGEGEEGVGMDIHSVKSWYPYHYFILCPCDIYLKSNNLTLRIKLQPKS